MIRFYMVRDDGAKLLVTGLSRAETTKLLDSEPVSLEDIAFPVRNVMFFAYKDRLHLSKLLRDTFKMLPPEIAMHLREAYPS